MLYFDNFQSNQWWKFHQDDDIFVTVNTVRTLVQRPCILDIVGIQCDHIYAPSHQGLNIRLHVI